LALITRDFILGVGKSELLYKSNNIKMAPSAMPITPPEDTLNVQKTSDLSAAAISKKLTSIPTLAPLDASKLIFTRTTNPGTVPSLDDPVIKTASKTTDHMITAVWHASTGWEAPHLKPYGPLMLMPTASVLHYATECFEGMKVYRGYDGKLRLFRPDCNTRRLLMSSTRISLPGFEPEEVEKLIMKFMAVDAPKSLPKSRPGSFLYLRPTMIGSEAALGVKAPAEATLFIIATYFPELSETPGGLSLLASSNDEVRAWPGGFGFAKVGANYGPSLLATQEARTRGYDQILWLFGQEGMVTEAGASNFMVLWRTKKEDGGKLQLVTAPLGDKIILDGVTRRSVLQLARERLASGEDGLEAVEVVERTFTMTDVVEACEEGRMIEALACGTAYFVTPVSTVHYKGKDLKMPMAKGTSGEYTALLKSWLVNIMYGKEDHEWGVVVKEVEA
jgi:branched-chain amino acid aminotransferase